MENHSLVQAYLNDALKYNIINKEMELALAKKAKEGDRKSYDYIICSNLRLVLKYARYYSSKYSCEFLELTAVGNEALIKAWKNFDAELGFRFTTYADAYIRRDMLAMAKKQLSIRDKHCDIDIDAIDRTESPNVIIEEKVKRALKHALSKLSLEETEVIYRRYYEHRTLSNRVIDIAQDLNLSTRQTRYIEQRALRKLKDCLSISD